MARADGETLGRRPVPRTASRSVRPWPTAARSTSRGIRNADAKLFARISLGILRLRLVVDVMVEVDVLVVARQEVTQLVREREPLPRRDSSRSRARSASPRSEDAASPSKPSSELDDGDVDAERPLRRATAGPPRSTEPSRLAERVRAPHRASRAALLGVRPAGGDDRGPAATAAGTRATAMSARMVVYRFAASERRCAPLRRSSGPRSPAPVPRR